VTMDRIMTWAEFRKRTEEYIRSRCKVSPGFFRLALAGVRITRSVQSLSRRLSPSRSRRGGKQIRILHLGQVHSPHFASVNKFIKQKFASNHIRQRGYLLCSYPVICWFKEVDDEVFDYSNYGYLKTVQQRDWEDSLLFKAHNPLVPVMEKVRRLLKNWKPDLVWIHELQSGGYLYLDAVDRLGKNTPVIASAYGNDLYFFRDSRAHRQRLQKLLPMVDLLHVETERDKLIALEFGYENAFAPFCSVCFKDHRGASAFKHDGERNIYLLIKGSHRLRSDLGSFFRLLESKPQFWVGRKIVVFNASNEDRFFCERIGRGLGIDIEATGALPHTEVLEMMSRSRFHLSVTLSDGVANTCAEAVTAGCIPLITNHNGFFELVPRGFLQHLCFTLPLSVSLYSQMQALDDDKALKNEILRQLNATVGQYYSDEIYDQFFEKVRDLAPTKD